MRGLRSRYWLHWHVMRLIIQFNQTSNVVSLFVALKTYRVIAELQWNAIEWHVYVIVHLAKPHFRALKVRVKVCNVFAFPAAGSPGQLSIVREDYKDAVQAWEGHQNAKGYTLENVE
jgi:hypothetical protein